MYFYFFLVSLHYIQIYFNIRKLRLKKNGEVHIAVVSRLKWYKFLDNMDWNLWVNTSVKFDMQPLFYKEVWLWKDKNELILHFKITYGTKYLFCIIGVWHCSNTFKQDNRISQYNLQRSLTLGLLHLSFRQF